MVPPPTAVVVAICAQLPILPGLRPTAPGITKRSKLHLQPQELPTNALLALRFGEADGDPPTQLQADMTKPLASEIKPLGVSMGEAKSDILKQTSEQFVPKHVTGRTGRELLFGRKFRHSMQAKKARRRRARSFRHSMQAKKARRRRSCPWKKLVGLKNRMRCMDGSSCSIKTGARWYCCNAGGRGGRAQCPKGHTMCPSTKSKSAQRA